jgi:hypothetical protein
MVVMAVATAACSANGSKTVPADAALASTGGGAATGGVQGTGGMRATGDVSSAGG